MKRVVSGVCLGLFTLVLSLSGCAPTADFSADTTGGTQPLKVTFTDKSATLDPLRINYNSLAPVYGWEWDFGDETGSTAQDPTHTYTIAGTYTVSLSVRNTFGEDTVVKQNLIKVTTPATGPDAKFSFTVDAENNLKIKFKDDSNPGSRPITNWLWDFGDNSTSTEQNPEHVYAKAGIYKVVLRVTSVVSSDEVEQSVPVAQANPTADFRWQADSEDGLTIIFTDESVAGSQAITKWEWSFGDGAVSTEQNPRHKYAQAGQFTVKLTVTTSAGKDDFTTEVPVTATPAATEGES